MDTLVVENKDGHQAYEIAQQDPVAEGCHLYLVCLHAHAHEDVDEHGAGVADHQSDEEQYAALYATRLERLEHEVRRAARLLKVEEQKGGEHTDSCCPADSWTVVPIVNLAVDRDIDERAAHEAEHHHVAELGERQRTVLCGVGVVRHAQKGDEQGHEYGAEHGIIDHLPVVVVSEPCRYPCAYLSEEHEEEIDDRLARLLLRVESVPSCLVDRLVAGRDVACGLYAEAILDEREEVAHEQGLPDEAHDQAVESEDEQAVGVGTDVALHSQQGEAYEAHHLLAAHADQGIEERRERRHAYGRDEAQERDMFRLDAKPAHHLATVDGVGAAHRHDRYEKDDEEGDAQGLWHPVVERKILRQVVRHRRIYLCLCHLLKLSLYNNHHSGSQLIVVFLRYSYKLYSHRHTLLNLHKVAC